MTKRLQIILLCGAACSAEPAAEPATDPAADAAAEAKRIDTAMNQTVEIQQAAEIYMAQKRGKCPETLQDLRAAGVTAKVAKDPWGQDYVLKCPGEHLSIDVLSGGPDGKLGTDDDVANYY
jgi:general secretion pathway protein G